MVCGVADAGDMLSAILEQQTLATVKGSRLPREGLANKQAILAQYSQVCDGEEYPFPPPALGPATAPLGGQVRGQGSQWAACFGGRVRGHGGQRV